MYRGSGPRILPIIIVIIVAALVIAALVTAGRLIFSNTNKSDTPVQNSSTSVRNAVLDRGSSRGVRWTVRGPIVADEKFRSYQVAVTPTSRTFTVYSGYLDQPTDTHSYDNNDKAYEQFVYALDKADISKTRPANNEDFRGVCATKGIAYMFETLNNGAADQSLWSSTCKDSPGTMSADALKVQALFVNQIPDFKPLFNQVY